MEDKKDLEEKSEFKMFNPDEYEKVMQALGPERRMHYVLHNKVNGKYGLIYNKKDTEDQGFYAPYLMYVIGKKCGINVPETELGYYLINDIDQLVPSYKDSFFESSLVYTGIAPIFGRNVSHVSQQVVDATYLSENPQAAEKRRDQDRGRVQNMNFEEYVESNVYYLISRGSKPRQEYSRAEIDAMRQELVDRAMFGLKLGIQGQTTIDLFDHRNARLSPYFLSSHNMLLLGINNNWVSSTLKESDEDFKESIEYELRPQFGIPYNYIVPTSEQLLAHIFETYPEQAERAYKKVTAFSQEDLEAELNSYTHLDETHKKMALRIFEMRDKEFQKVHDEQKKSRTQNKG